MLSTGSFVDSSGVDNLRIQQLDAKRMRFLGDNNNVTALDIMGTVPVFLEKLKGFLSKLPSGWGAEMGPVLRELRVSENWTLFSNLAISVASSFGNNIPKQLQRFGNSLVEAACRAAFKKKDADSSGWHGVRTRDIEALTGLQDLSASSSVQDAGGSGKQKVQKKVTEAAHLFASHVREVFADVGAVQRTAEGGVAPNDISNFIFECKHEPTHYGAALAAIKRLQEIWRMYFPMSDGVLVWPCKRKKWMIRIANSNLVFLRGQLNGRAESWEEWFDRNAKVPGRQPAFGKFVGSKGGIITDGFRLSLYGERASSNLQRTEKRSTAELGSPDFVSKVVSYLNGQPDGNVNSDANALGSAANAMEPAEKIAKIEVEVSEPSRLLHAEKDHVAATGDDGSPPGVECFDYTGIVRLETAVKKGVVDELFFDDRPILTLDPGGKYSEAGAFIRNWELFKFFRVSSRDFARRTGRDQIEKEGLRTRTDFGGIGSSRRNWERLERAATQVLFQEPDVRKWADEYDSVALLQTRRAKSQSRVWALEQKFLFEMLDSIKHTFGSMGGSKPPVIVLGRDGGHGQGVRGTRGNYSGVLLKFLAEFFLVLTVGEHNTTKMCPCCHKESVFAKRSEIRSKKCEHGCGSVYKDRRSGNIKFHAFCYDRDFGAVRKTQKKKKKKSSLNVFSYIPVNSL